MYAGQWIFRGQYVTKPAIAIDLNYEATMSASESHCHDVPVPVSKVLVQRSQTVKVYREVYRVSKLQSALRAC